MMRRHSQSGWALLLCNGEPPEGRLARKLARMCTLRVAADGGANIALAIGVRPDVIIGDLDSVRPSTVCTLSESRIIRVRRQDNTDVEKALDFLGEEGFRNILLMGTTGRRIDMTLANLSIIWRYAPRMNLMIVGTGWHAVPVHGSRRLRAPVGTTVSLLPATPCHGVTLRGLRYPLTDGSLTTGEVAVSNVVTRPSFSVVITRGKALVIVLAALTALEK
jgi:thiamine pyrophosphokinase